MTTKGPNVSGLLSLCPLLSAGDVADGRCDPGDLEIDFGTGLPKVLQQRCGSKVPEASAVRGAVSNHLREGLSGKNEAHGSTLHAHVFRVVKVVSYLLLV